jgi:hypothetical protein
MALDAMPLRSWRIWQTASSTFLDTFWYASPLT